MAHAKTKKKKKRWQRKWRVGIGGVVVVGEGQRKEGARASERGPDSVPTLLITVSLETERGLPLALGNSLGPVAERGQRWRRREGWRVVGRGRGRKRKGGI